MAGERFPPAATFSAMRATERNGWPACVAAVAGRPRLWRPALRQALRLAPRRWWRHRPFLPLPPAAYLDFRSVTAYGGSGTAPLVPEDVCTYLAWSDRFPRARA